jgi:hypothetical protein
VEELLVLAMSPRQRLLDSLAIGASMLCLVHCLLLPLVILLLPMLAHILDVPEEFHLAVFLLAVPTSLLALRAGWRQHGCRAVWLPALSGLTLLAAGLFVAPTEAAEVAVTVAGSLLLALGHLLNWRRSAGACASKASDGHP